LVGAKSGNRTGSINCCDNLRLQFEMYSHISLITTNPGTVLHSNPIFIRWAAWL
jgi:hypothetical protein